MPRKLSEDVIKKIREMRMKGHSIRYIAEQLGVSPTTVYAYTRDMVKRYVPVGEK